MKPIGILGTGNFGLTVATLASKNRDILIYGRRKEIVDSINKNHEVKGISLPPNVRATHDLSEVASVCQLIFPIIPSANFREVIKSISPFLKPYHILIHGTKGFDIEDGAIPNKSTLKTMTDVMLEETLVLRVGCLSGPNLSREILEGQPCATVVASEYDEVIEAGQEILAGDNFFVFDSYDLKGTELSGIFKNIIAIGTGMMAGYGYGKNVEALLITRGLREMIYFGQKWGSTGKAFLGTAGIGDLIATATSEKSRNYRFGYRLGQGESLEDIAMSSSEVAEGVRTLAIVHEFAKNEKWSMPITSILHGMCYGKINAKTAISMLMRMNYTKDVDFTI